MVGIVIAPERSIVFGFQDVKAAIASVLHTKELVDDGFHFRISQSRPLPIVDEEKGIFLTLAVPDHWGPHQEESNQKIAQMSGVINRKIKPDQFLSFLRETLENYADTPHAGFIQAREEAVVRGRRQQGANIIAMYENTLEAQLSQIREALEKGRQPEVDALDFKAFLEQKSKGAPVGFSAERPSLEECMVHYPRHAHVGEAGIVKAFLGKAVSPYLPENASKESKAAHTKALRDDLVHQRSIQRWMRECEGVALKSGSLIFSIKPQQSDAKSASNGAKHTVEPARPGPKIASNGAGAHATSIVATEAGAPQPA